MSRMTLHSYSFLMKKIKEELNASPRVRFTVQSGETWVLTEKDILTTFTDFGKIQSVNFIGNLSHGIIVFNSASDAKKILNKVVEVKGCLLHTFIDFYDLSPFPSSHQILMESENFPKSWERDIIIKNFFKMFGEVTGINFFKKNSSLVVSFKEDIASMMTGSLLQVRWRSERTHLIMMMSGALGPEASLHQGGLLPHRRLLLRGLAEQAPRSWGFIFRFTYFCISNRYNKIEI